MANVERLREFVASTPEREYFTRKQAEGWRLVSIHWERDVAPGAQVQEPAEQTPYGLQVADDCQHLAVQGLEKQALHLIMDMVVKDEPLSRVADELNRQGFRTRQGVAWNTTDIFNLLPRLIEAGPRIFSNEEYIARRAGQRTAH